MADVKERPVTLAVTVFGKIDRVGFNAPIHYTTVLCPAADEYSGPQVVRIRSERPLGSVGQEITQACRLGGYKRPSFQTKGDPSRGVMPETIFPVELTLDVI